MLVDTDNTSDQFITRLVVDMDIYEDLHGCVLVQMVPPRQLVPRTNYLGGTICTRTLC